MMRLLSLAHGAAGYLFAAAMLALGLWHFALYLRAMRSASCDTAQQEAEESPQPPDAEDLQAEETLPVSDAQALPHQAPMQATPRAQKDAPAGLDGWDVCAIVVAGLIAAVIRGVLAYWGWPPESLQSYPALVMHVLIGPYVLIGSCYAIVRRLGGGRMVCALCTLIAAANITWSALGVPFALLALLFVLRSMDEGRSRAANQAVAAVFAAFGIYLDASAALFAAGLWVIVIVDGIAALRLQDSGPRTGSAICRAALFPLTLAAAYFVMQLPGAAVQGVTVAEFGRWLLLRLYEAFAGLISLPSDWTILPDSLVCMLYGVICAGLALWSFAKARDRRALIAGGAALISALALVFADFRLAPVGSVLAAGHIWGRWDTRGGKTQVLLGGGMLLALCVLIDLFALWGVH